jgi:Protein of unknown function (DUF4238)
MPAHKNQHFVPRCALKPFTLNDAGAAINLHNIKSKRAIQNAPVKGQCARDYLYGKGNTERLLGDLEGHYSRIITWLADGDVFSKTDEAWLRTFINIQQRRTELSIVRFRDVTENIADKVFARAPQHRPQDNRSDAELMHASLAIAINSMEYVNDLKIVILRNLTNELPPSIKGTGQSFHRPLAECQLVAII